MSFVLLFLPVNHLSPFFYVVFSNPPSLFDGGPSTEQDLGLQVNQGSPSVGAKVQEMV